MARQEPKKLRVLLVDDHALVRAGIRALLERLPWLNVAGEANDGREALGIIKSANPDLVLMDIAMEGLNGLEAAARIARDHPEIKIVILSMYRSEDFLLQALRAGAVGYLLKQSATAELETALRTVSRDETSPDPAISKSILNSLIVRLGQARGGPLDKLTPRQREVLQLVAEGKTTKEIGFILNLSGKTVDAHRADIMRRLNINEVVGLTRFAMRVGLVAPEI